MVETHGGKLYTGITTDVERRFAEHKAPTNPRSAKFFRSDPAKQVVYIEPCKDRSSASQREYRIKKMDRQKKWLLVASQASG